MKRSFFILFCICLLLTTTGCGQNAADSTLPGSSASAPGASATVPDAPAAFSAPMAAVSLPLVNETETALDGTTLFTYTYQNVYLILQDPEVADAVILDLMNRIDSTQASAESIRATVQSSYALANSWTPYLFQVIYHPMRIDQGILSLYGTQVSYSGTPHPSRLSISANYDLYTGKALYFADILTESYSSQQLCQLIEEALEPQKESLYAYYPDILEERFGGDLSGLETWYFSETGLSFYFSPYDIAPYSAGTIFAEIPYEKLSGILKEDYFPADYSSLSGSITAAPFQSVEQGQFSQFAELILSTEAEPLLLSTEGTVSNIRIELGSLTTDSGFTAEATVFAAESLSAEEAIMLQADLSETAPALRLTYNSENETIRVFISDLLY